MKPEDVNPEKWHDPNYPKIVLYNDIEYSIVWGKYEGIPALGGRWNGEDEEVGFPNQGGNPTWFVEPDAIAEVILQGILVKARLTSDNQKIRDIIFALDELKKKMAINKGEELKPVDVNMRSQGVVYKDLEERINVFPEHQWFVHWLSLEEYESNKDTVLSLDNVVVCSGEHGLLQTIFTALSKKAKGNNHRTDDNLIGMKCLYVHSKPRE